MECARHSQAKRRDSLAAIMSAAWLLRHLTMSVLAHAVDAVVEEVVRGCEHVDADRRRFGIDHEVH